MPPSVRAVGRPMLYIKRHWESIRVICSNVVLVSRIVGIVMCEEEKKTPASSQHVHTKAMEMTIPARRNEAAEPARANVLLRLIEEVMLCVLCIDSTF